MNTASLFGVYTAKFPFLDSSKVKVRPVIVLSMPYGRHATIAVVPISSRIDLEPVDITIKGWANAGLLKPSVARVHRVTTMLQIDLIAELGILELQDIKNLKASMRLLFNL